MKNWLLSSGLIVMMWYAYCASVLPVLEKSWGAELEPYVEALTTRMPRGTWVPTPPSSHGGVITAVRLVELELENLSYLHYLSL